MEDEPYRELGFAGSPAPPPTLKDFDQGEGLVVRLGTVSKTLAAGLRLGWVVAPEGVVEQLALVKARADLCGNAPTQLVVAEMLAADLFDAHVASLREEHGRRHRALVRSLERRLPSGTLSWRRRRKDPMEKPTASTKGLLACGAIAGPLFVATFLVEGATRANYDPLRHPVSSLELGPLGWAQSANFVVAGLLMLAFAFGPPRARPGGRSWSACGRWA